MAIDGYDFKLNGVYYDAAEDSEGEHYVENASPLRPPNAVTVIGETTQKFQMRPDVLQWNITDWSGGMGDQLFDPKAPNRMWEIKGDPFSDPGQLHGAWFNDEAQRGGGDFTHDCILVRHLGELLAVHRDGNGYSVWSGTDFNTETTYTGGAANYWKGVSDGADIYLVYNTGIDVLDTGTDTASGLGTATGSVFGGIAIEAGNVYTTPATATAIAIEETTKAGVSTDIAYHENLSDYADIAALDGKVYSMSSAEGVGTQILEITPTSAAGPGFGGEVALIEGYVATSIWTHSGTLFMVGHTSGNPKDRSVMYLSPNGAYGTLGRIGHVIANPGFDDEAIGDSQMNKFLEHHVIIPGHVHTSFPTLYQIDAVTGGFAIVGGNTGISPYGTITNFRNAVAWENAIFMSIDGSSGSRVVRYSSDLYGDTFWFKSTWNDFGLAEPKILSSVTLTFSALPANWTVSAILNKNNSTTNFNLAIDQGTTGDTEITIPVSTQASTTTFNTMRLYVYFSYSGGDSTATAPTLYGVDVLAQVNRPLKQWHLMMDLSDDHDWRGEGGAVKITNIKTAGAGNTVVEFIDGYGDREPGVSTEYDVVVDSYSLHLERPGEGVARVVLTEVA